MMIGIDFGTTNSGVAIWTPQGAHMIEVAGRQETLPSAVAQTKDGFVRGRDALAQLDANPDYTFRAVKRYLGRDYNEQEHGHFQLAEGPDGKVWWRGRDQLIAGPVLVAEVLKSLLIAAESHLKRKPSGAVIAHPVNFLPDQKAALVEAATLAGLTRVELFEEPYAAALSFGIGLKDFSRVAVYDLGGGTFDATILHMKNGITAPAGMSGIGFLGGTDFDDRLVEYCADRFFKEHGEDIRARPHCMIRVQKEAERVKIELSDHEKVTLYVPDLVAVPSRGFLSMKYEITRLQFEELTKDLVARTMTALQDALKQSDLSKREIEHVLLIGGQSRMPLIRRVVSKYFGNDAKIAPGPHPEYAVALGAAIKAAEEDGRKPKGVLERIAPVTTGLMRYGGAFVPVIQKGEKFPASRTVEITAFRDGQEMLEIAVYQGEAPAAEDNDLVFTHVLSIEPKAADDVTIPVVFDIDAGGLLTVRAGDEIVYGIEQEAAA